MSKKIIKALGIAMIIFAVLLGTIPAFPSSAVVPDEFQLDKNSLAKYMGTSLNVSVPNEITEIGEEAFSGNQTIAQVDTGNGTKVIKHGAFSNSPYLRTVTNHDNLEEIETAAFAGNTNLASINFGSNMSKLGYGVFAGCNNLSTINISRNNSDFLISGGALYNSSGDTLYAFLGGYNATYYRMPNSVKNISKYCFWGNEKLDSISVSSYVDNIPAYAFSNCKNLKTVNIPYSVDTIDAKAFENCISLVDVLIPPSVKYIDPTAFDGCVKLNIIADPGTAAYNFFQNFDTSDIANTETGDVNIVIYPEEETGTGVSGRNGESSENGNESESGTDSENGEGANYQESYRSFVNAADDPSNVEYMPKSNPLSLPDNSDVIAKTVVVGGKAVIFLSSNQTVHEGMTINSIENSDTSDKNDGDSEPVLYDSSKGGYLPKYDKVGTKIASQAYYANQKMENYSIPTGITAIGDFAFARSNISSINIPDGVESIGYGAFYHCDNLGDVSIPVSVKDIAGFAFENTAYINNFKSNVSSGDFLIVGDGILLAYKGTASDINVPEGVKKIGAGAFMEHEEIVSVNLPSSLKVIGEDAFRGCSNLEKVTGGSNITVIEDRAYMGCPLKDFTVTGLVEKMGLKSVDFSKTNKSDDTKTVIFEGSNLPKISVGSTSSRLENDEYRHDVLYNVLFAVVDSSLNEFKQTVLDNEFLGFSGVIVSVEKDASGNETGNVIIKENYIFSDEVLSKLPNKISIRGKDYNIKDREKLTIGANTRKNAPNQAEVNVIYNGSPSKDIIAKFSETERVSSLNIAVSKDAENILLTGYKELFGNDNTPSMAAYDIYLFDETGTVPINKFGNASLTITMPLPEGIKGDTYHVITTDADGQLEEVRAVLNEEAKSISFSTNHLSYFGIYATDATSPTSILKSGKIVTDYKKDNSPNTGDSSLPIRYVGAFAMLCTGLFVFIYSGKRGKVHRN